MQLKHTNIYTDAHMYIYVPNFNMKPECLNSNSGRRHLKLALEYVYIKSKLLFGHFFWSYGFLSFHKKCMNNVRLS